MERAGIFAYDELIQESWVKEFNAHAKGIGRDALAKRAGYDSRQSVWRALKGDLRAALNVAGALQELRDEAGIPGTVPPPVVPVADAFDYDWYVIGQQIRDLSEDDRAAVLERLKKIISGAEALRNLEGSRALSTSDQHANSRGWERRKPRR